MVDPSPSSETVPASTCKHAVVDLPLDDPPSDEDDLVGALAARCSSPELRRAERRHRRALTALTSGQYDALSDDTRADLIQHLRTHLGALTRARHHSEHASSTDAQEASETDSSDRSALWGALRGLW